MANYIDIEQVVATFPPLAAEDRANRNMWQAADRLGKQAFDVRTSSSYRPTTTPMSMTGSTACTSSTLIAFLVQCRCQRALTATVSEPLKKPRYNGPSLQRGISSA